MPEPPRLLTAEVVRAGIARGVREGKLAYTSGTVPTLGPDGKFQASREKAALGRAIADDEIDLDTGFIMLPSAVPAAATPATQTGGSGGGQEPEDGGRGGSAGGSGGGPGGGVKVPPVSGKRTVVELVFDATRDQLYKTFPALANLADKADGGKVTLRIEACSAAGFDPAWLRNAVEEPLDEADIERR